MLVEAGVAVGWVASRWPGLLTEVRRVLPDIEGAAGDMDAQEMLHRAIALADKGQPLEIHPLLGQLPLAYTVPQGLSDKLRRSFGRMPWTTTQKRLPRPYSVPMGGDGGVRNPNLPPPSRPQDNDLDITPDHRPGIPYPEWNAWTKSFMRDHVAVLERADPRRSREPVPVAANLRKWFEEHTHRAMTGRLEDGSDLDVEQYVSHYIDLSTGEATEPRIFRELLPSSRDVTTALLLDGSSSLGVHGGRIFRLELVCADALSRAMTLARERHGVFVFTGNTRHRVEVQYLKDFEDRRFVSPSRLGLTTSGYTRLGAPLRHLTRRLLAQPSERRLLIVFGDGLISDEGYEGRYAWADAAHAVEEANDAGVSVYYVGVGPTRVDPLPEVFGPRRSQRIRRVEELPRVLAHVHRELVAA
jgi:nitric oxide reductase activation protein